MSTIFSKTFALPYFPNLTLRIKLYLIDHVALYLVISCTQDILLFIRWLALFSHCIITRWYREYL